MTYKRWSWRPCFFFLHSCPWALQYISSATIFFASDFFCFQKILALEGLKPSATAIYYCRDRSKCRPRPRSFAPKPRPGPSPKPQSRLRRGNGMSISLGMMDGACQQEGCGVGMVQERAGGRNGKMDIGQPGQMRGLWGHLGCRGGGQHEGMTTTPDRMTTTTERVTLNGRT